MDSSNPRRAITAGGCASYVGSQNDHTPHHLGCNQNTRFTLPHLPLSKQKPFILDYYTHDYINPRHVRGLIHEVTIALVSNAYQHSLLLLNTTTTNKPQRRINKRNCNDLRAVTNTLYCSCYDLLYNCTGCSRGCRNESLMFHSLTTRVIMSIRRLLISSLV